MYRVWTFITGTSALLIVGALIALVWANLAPESYFHVVEYPLWFNPWIGSDIAHWAAALGPASSHFEIGDVERVLTLRGLVNDFLMAFFFAFAGKEVWEALVLKNGALRGRAGAVPLFASFGGIVAPAGLFLLLALAMGSDTYDALSRGWAVPTATDLALTYLVGRWVFGADHPALRFLMLLALVDDAAGSIIIAVAYPSGSFAPEWLLVAFAAAFTVFFLFNWLPIQMDRHDPLQRRTTWVRRRLGVLPYVLAGLVSFYAVARSGLNPALGLLPLIPAIPHADRAFGVFAEAERHLRDPLNTLQNMLRRPVEVILFLFGLVNAGVLVSAANGATWAVLVALIVGKPLGIFCCGWLAARVFGLGLPTAMQLRDLVVVGFLGAVGFTLSLFLASNAFDPGPWQEGAKLGTLMGFVAIPVAFAVAALLRIERQSRADEGP